MRAASARWRSAWPEDPTMAPKYTQAGRTLSLTTPLGADVLLLETLEGSEALSELFRFELGVLTAAPASWKFESLLGQAVTAKVLLPDGSSSRCFSGIVSRVTQGGQVVSALGPDKFLRYRLEVVPSLWLLTRSFRSRIFQQLSVPDILKQVLTGLDVSWEIQGTFKPRDYCVQYHETDFDFASRLMEEEGIWYRFKHADGACTLVVANTPQSHAAVPGPATVSYQTTEGGAHPDDRIKAWQKTQEVRSGKLTLWDHCFELPGQNLQAGTTASDTISAGTVAHKQALGVNGKLEIYDYPGRYAQRFDGIAPGGGDRAADVQNIFQDNARTAGIRMKEEQVPGLVIEGDGNARNLTAGCKFTLADHFDANGDYVLTRVECSASQEGAYTTGHPSPLVYQNRFRCIPLALPFVPQRTTPRPVVAGPQSAVVVGPSGEEIFTDKYSRVKVQFAWDREGKNDASSSCWVRVGTPWAGKQWGMIHIPRIGQEVIVVFEEGDPDRPIIVGSVYNADQMPPYALPDNRTQSGVKTRSSLQGTTDNFNELRFEDKKDKEEVYFHAEKDFNRVVENNDTLKVGFLKTDKGDQTIEIFNNQSQTVGKPNDQGKDPTDGSQTEAVWNNQGVTVGAGKAKAADGSQTVSIWNNQTLTVGSGEGQNADGSQTITVYKNRTETVKTGDETVTIEQGNRLVDVKTGNDTHKVETGNRVVEIDTGNDTLTIKTGNHTITVSSGTSSLEAAQSITLKVGSSSIKIEPGSITLQASAIKLQGQAQIQAQASIIQVNADGTLKLQGGVVNIN
jgi:type VI secretion system secreted protein VgrG